MRVLILGATGMLGHMLFEVLEEDDGLEVFGSIRRPEALRHFPTAARPRLLLGVDALDNDALVSVFERIRPDVVINAVGLVKQRAEALDPMAALPMNALLPLRLARLCSLVGARMIHVSTDCVFSGATGSYKESDPADARDVYGLSKFLGEIRDQSHVVTLRTSIIGPELGSSHGLIEWFLSQDGEIKGFSRALFSGLPTVELARIVRDQVIPRPDLSGLYHVSSEPISKLELLRLVAEAYDKRITITADPALVIDRSLNSDRFRAEVGYVPPDWPSLVAAMKGRHSTKREARC